MIEFEYPSKGAGSIHAYRWEPAGKPVAVLQIIHGIAEHAARYDEMARFFTQRGVLVTAEDHMGHGRSSGTDAPLCFSGGWTAAVDDSYALLERTHREFPDVPYLLFGHSMGSFLTRTLLYRYPNAPLRAVILCGTAWEPWPILTAGRALCALEKKRLGATGYSPLLNALMFGMYNRKFPDAQTPDDWICARREVVDAYSADPLCGGKVTVGLSGDMLRGIRMNQDKRNLAAMPKALPVHFIAGKNDPVGSMGKGVQKAADAFRKAGMQHVTLKLYDGRHEIHNEDVRQTVFADAWNFYQSAL